MHSLVCGLVSLSYPHLSVLVSLVVAVVWSTWTGAVKQHNPPLVLHYIPYLGNAIAYGMDPYKFFADCKEKVD